MMDEYFLQAALGRLEEAEGENLADAVAMAVDFLENLPTPESLRQFQLAVIYTMTTEQITEFLELKKKVLGEVSNGQSEG